MDNAWDMALALIGGLILGAIFFGGLWWTVRRGLTSKRPLLWVFVSLLSRIAITMAGFYVIGQQRWESWLLCLVGFILARFIVQGLTRSSTPNQAALPEEAKSAP